MEKQGLKVQKRGKEMQTALVYWHVHNGPNGVSKLAFNQKRAVP